MLKPKLPQLTKKQNKKVNHLLSYFDLEGNSFEKRATEGQKVMFYNFVFRPVKEIEIICATQYGKSLITALAALIISCVEGKVVAIVAPKKEKAKIIMRYYIEHLGDSPLFFKELEQNTKLERLRQEESKERIILRNGGGVYTLSANQRNLKRSVESAMGMGAEIVMLDEAGLITDSTEATIFRMVGGKDDYFYAKIGNPFYSQPPYTHFKKDWENPEMKKIFINYKQAMKEGRFSKDFIERAKTKPLFDVLYKCEFPKQAQVDRKGYRQLLRAEDISYFKDEEELLKQNGELKLGVDIGAGSDLNVFVLRKGKRAIIESWNQSEDTMANLREIQRILEEYKELEEESIAIDDIGVGRGVSDRCKELGLDVNGVAVGTKARNPETYYNLKAELYWNAKKWVEGEGKLLKDKGWQQLTWIKYRTHTGERQIQIEPKQQMKKRTNGKSSDYADAFALSFFEPPFVGII